MPLDASHEDTRQTEARIPDRYQKWRITLDAAVFTAAGERLPLDEVRASSRTRLLSIALRDSGTVLASSGYGFSSKAVAPG